MRQYTPRRSSQKWLEGAPRAVIAIYDSGPKFADRYTVLYGYPAWVPDMGFTVPYFAMSERPCHPQGVGQHGDMKASDRRCLGKKIRWVDLPTECQHAVIQDCKE